LTAQLLPGTMTGMGRSHPSSAGSLGRIVLAIGLVYLLLLRALFLPFPVGSLPAGLGPLGALPICAHGSRGVSSPDDPSGNPASNHDCCDSDCCLMRIAGLASLILVASLVLSGRFFARALVYRPRRRIASHPPPIASRPQAPRAPPRLAFV
jgi:hypothetical protein